MFESIRKSRGLSTLVVVISILVVEAVGAQCIGHMSEALPPPSVVGMATTDPGFVARYWAWDDFNNRRGGFSEPLIMDSDGGVLVADLDWDDAGYCFDPGPVERSAVLLESRGPDGFGRWALVNLGADQDGEIDVDHSQRLLGQVSSLAVPVPETKIDEIRVDDDLIEIDVSWEVDWRGEALSDLVGDCGEPLPSIRGYAVHIINGPAATSRPWDWTFGKDVQPDEVNGYSTDTRATIRLPRGDLWDGEVVCFALNLSFDGNGDAEGELPGSRSVRGVYLGHPSRWMAVPETGYDEAVEIVDLTARLAQNGGVIVDFVGQAEPAGCAYRVWMLMRDGRRVFLGEAAGGLGTYSLGFERPSWHDRPAEELEVEMLDHLDRSIDSEVVPIRIGPPRLVTVDGL